jgi:hypothetical protein
MVRPSSAITAYSAAVTRCSVAQMVASRSRSAPRTSIASFSKRRPRFSPQPMTTPFSTKPIHPYDIPPPLGGQHFKRTHEKYLTPASKSSSFQAVSTDINGVSEHVRRQSSPHNPEVTGSNPVPANHRKRVPLLVPRACTAPDLDRTRTVIVPRLRTVPLPLPPAVVGSVFVRRRESDTELRIRAPQSLLCFTTDGKAGCVRRLICRIVEKSPIGSGLGSSWP